MPQVVDHEMDYYLDYTLESTLGAMKPLVDSELAAGRPLGADRPLAKKYVDKLIHGSVYAAEAHALLAILADLAPGAAEEKGVIADLARLRGNADVGAKVFQRTCVACHKVGEQGAQFGPNQSDVGLRLKREEIIVSILDPNAKLDPKYQTVLVLTDQGKAFSGLVAEETGETLTLLVGAGKLQPIPQESIEERKNVNVSSMPAKLHESMSSKEFVDLLEYLAAQKKQLDQPSSNDTQ